MFFEAFAEPNDETGTGRASGKFCVLNIFFSFEHEDQKLPLFWVRPNVFGTLLEPKDEAGTGRARVQIVFFEK